MPNPAPTPNPMTVPTPNLKPTPSRMPVLNLNLMQTPILKPTLAPNLIQILRSIPSWVQQPPLVRNANSIVGVSGPQVGVSKSD